MHLVNINDMEDAPRPKAFVEGLLYPGQISLVFGASGIGKSAFVVDMLTRCSLEQSIDGRITRYRDIVWLATENPAEHQFRLKGVMRHLGQNTDCETPAIGNHFVTLSSFQLLGDAFHGNFDRLRTNIRHQCKVPPVIVIDTLNQAIPGADENNSSTMNEVVFNAKRLLTDLRGCHVMLVHHSGKDAGRGARGHSSLTAAMDTVIAVSQLKNCVQAKVVKQRCGPGGEVIKFNLESRPVDPEDPNSETIVFVDYV